MASARSTSGADPLAAAARAAELVRALAEPDDDAALRWVGEILARHGETDAPARDDLPALRAAADGVRAVFAATDVAAAAAAINALFLRYGRLPRLTDHDGTTWHLHVDRDDDGPWAEWFAAGSALALAVLLAAWQAPPGGMCAAPDCVVPFVAHGAGTPRRYCSSRCATRVRVARHRGGR